MNNIEKNNEEIVDNQESVENEIANERPENSAESDNNEEIKKDIETKESHLESKSTEIAGAIDKKESLIALGIKELKKTFFSVTNSSDTKIKKQVKGQISELDELFEANLGEKRAPIFEE